MNVREIEVVYGRKTPAGQFASETISLSVRGDVAGDGFDRAVSEAFSKARELVAEQMRISEGREAPTSHQHDEQGAGETIKADAFENSSVITMTEPKEGEMIGDMPVVFSYTTEQAIEDGVLVYVGDVGRSKVYFTGNLMAEGYDDLSKRGDLVYRGLELLRKPDAEDTPYMHLRVIEKDRWVIAEPGKLTYMKPEDY